MNVYVSVCVNESVYVWMYVSVRVLACMSVIAWIYDTVCVNVSMYAWMYMTETVRVCMCECMYVYVSMCKCEWVCRNVCECECVNVSLCVCVCVCVCASSSSSSLNCTNSTKFSDSLSHPSHQTDPLGCIQCLDRADV